MPLVLVGPAGRWARELPNVTLTGAVSDDELAAIYSGAHALVFPSDEEGFGLPPVEALACGTPVAAFDIPAVREVLDGRIALSAVGDLDGLIARPSRGAARPTAACVHLGRCGARDVGGLLRGRPRGLRPPWHSSPMTVHAPHPGSADGGTDPGLTLHSWKLFDIPITRARPAELLATISDWASERATHRVMYVNAHVINCSQTTPELAAALRRADLVYGEGRGLRLAARALNAPRPFG